MFPDLVLALEEQLRVSVQVFCASSQSVSSLFMWIELIVNSLADMIGARNR